ncbi:hypothetical protein M422DRAFT_270299 [Sphaerobolus stellatus SS14]|uniref:Uncharacterized protein n=1 Tax=Sphaerobolus stellatus (strain SS14) TaxID=990650 RepID=A0A0C9USZ9_SPHS4|nr:hypothetical protein M422DRAFT_270299 [Sphaerobolus stellatus SS14]
MVCAVRLRYLPPLSLAPQSSLAGPTPASTFLGMLYYETDASGMCVHQSPPAPTTSRPPFPVLHGLPGDELASPLDNHDAWVRRSRCGSATAMYIQNGITPLLYLAHIWLISPR